MTRVCLSLQLHIVHYNKSKYSSFAEAASAADGLSVLGVFLKVRLHATRCMLHATRCRLHDAL